MSVVALTVADRGPGSISDISPNTSPAVSAPMHFACAPWPTMTSTDPETMKKAVLPSSPSKMIVSPALNATACMKISGVRLGGEP